jgi:hypothetical protein
VIVRVEKSLPPTKLLLYLIGKEKATVTVVGGDRPSPSAEENQQTYQGERVICSAMAVLREHGRTKIAPGTCIFPFEFALPASLPSIMNGVAAAGQSKSYPSWTIRYQLSLGASSPKGKTTIKVGRYYFGVASAPLPDERVPVLFHQNRTVLSTRLVDIVGLWRWPPE